jgi:DNA-binding transcriptional LysR family regulator
MLDLFEVFIVVADAGSFAEAARLLGVVPSTVSKKISALEERLGVTLFLRTTRSLSITAEGRMLYDEAREVVSRVDAIEEQLAVHADEPRGKVRITTFPDFGQLLLCRYLPEFHAKYPEIDIELSLTNRSVDIVGESFDVAIRYGVLPDSHLQARILGKYDYFVCASPDYLERCGRPETPADLADHACMTDLHTPSIRRWVFDVDGQRVEINPRGPLQADDPIARYFAATGGMGITVLPSLVARDAVKTGELVLLFEENPLHLGPIWALHAARETTPARVEVFLEFAGELGRRAQDLTASPWPQIR